jgi:transposase
VLYNWRSARKAASVAKGEPEAVAFVPLGVFNGAPGPTPALLPAPDVPLPPPRSRRGRSGAIEITLPNGARIGVDTSVNEVALSRVLRAMRSLT